MKTWQKYETILHSGHWHNHTHFSDGRSSVDDYCRAALKLGIPLIAITDHATDWLNSFYNEYLLDIEAARERYPDLIILSGAEVNVGLDGVLDIRSEFARQLDYILMAFHKFRGDANDYLDSLLDALENPLVSAWAHPGLIANRRRYEISPESDVEVLRSAIKHEVLIELNFRAGYPTKEFRNLANHLGARFVNGPDNHSVDHMFYRRGSF